MNVLTLVLAVPAVLAAVTAALAGSAMLGLTAWVPVTGAGLGLTLWLLWGAPAPLMLGVLVLPAAGSAFGFRVRYILHDVKDRARAMLLRARLRRRPGPGWATFGQICSGWSRRAMRRTAAQTRPGLGRRARLVRPATDYLVRYGRAQWFRLCCGPLENHCLIFGPPRCGKSGHLADRIIGHPGAAVVTSTDTDLADQTAPHRAKLGGLLFIDPEGLTGHPCAWVDPVAGCEHVASAKRAARGLIVPSTATGDLRDWQHTAELVLGALLHAAALGGLTLREVFRWASKQDLDRAQDLIKGDIRGSRELLAMIPILAANDKAAGSIRMILSAALSWVAVPELLAAAVPGPGPRLDPAAFAAGTGTLYLVAPDSADEHSPLAPLFRYITQEMHFAARRAASARRPRRLDPPMLFALDEVTQICPVPLPHWLADSARRGILMCPVVHSLGQIADRWGQHAADTILDTAGDLLVYGGLKNLSFYQRISDLVGRTKDAAGEDVPKVPADVLQGMPDFWAVVKRRGQAAPVMVRTRPAWERRRTLAVWCADAVAVLRSRRQALTALAAAAGHLRSWLSPLPDGPDPAAVADLEAELDDLADLDEGVSAAWEEFADADQRRPKS